MSTLETGAVVIGRNEGDRLAQCLRSLAKSVQHIVYVDSGSTDNSVANAKSLGVFVSALNMQLPFTAARARNVGFKTLTQIFPEVKFVQFVDGDCELISEWFDLAIPAFSKVKNLAVVCGRRIERFPENSIYNYQCNLEWDTPVGEAKACGGDFLIDVEAFKAVGGFNPELIAGEEPELCLRLRKSGWLIHRIEGDMTLHDANILSFKQWWKRNVRAGHAYAEGYYLHGKKPCEHKKKELLRSVLWGGFLPAVFVISIVKSWILSVSIVMLYVVQFFKIFRTFPSDQYRVQLSFLRMVSKLAEFQGVIVFAKNLLLGKKAKLIEYK